MTIATTGDSQDFGDLTVARRFLQGVGNSTRAIFGTGATPSSVNTIDYITMASTGNAVNFGDDIKIRLEGAAACSSPVRGTWGGGYSSPAGFNDISYITIATEADAVDFGDLLAATFAASGCSNGHGGLG